MSEPSPSQIPVGTILEGKFRITEEIGRGGMAAVYEAENIDIGKRVAVKILSSELVSSRIVRERFIREARAAAAIHSPYICQVFDSGMFHERPFLVMELLRGESLYQRMTRLRRLKISTTLKIIRQVARGLTKAHEAGVVHRDLKPENIVLTRDDDGSLVAKIVDFGLAKFYESRDNEPEKNIRLTREGALFGTPAYMSPEQVKGQGAVDHRADLWALACIVYECLTGQTVWDVQQGMAMILAQIAKGELPNPLDTCPDLPPSFVEWFQRALSPRLSQRYQTTRSFINALEAALDADLIPISSAEATRAFISEEESNPVHSIPEWRNSAAPRSLPGIFEERPKFRLLASLIALGALAMSCYAFLLYNDPIRAAQSTPLFSARQQVNNQAAQPRVPQEKGPGAEWIDRGQEALRNEELDDALHAFSNALGESPHVAQSLIAHAKAGQVAGGACALAGLGRPRPFELEGEASHPRILQGAEGLLAIWTDTHEDSSRRNVYGALLDDSLRRVSPVRNITPEATLAIQPQFAAIPSGFASIYWNNSPIDSGVFIRNIAHTGRISSPPHRLSEEKRAQYFPVLQSMEDGSLLAVWSEKKRAGIQNLVGQRLKADLSADGPSFYFTDLAAGSAMNPALDVVDGKIYLAFHELRPRGENTIRLLRLPASFRGLKKLTTNRVNHEATGISLRQRKRQESQQTTPQLSCNRQACMVVWDDEKAGSLAAFINHNDKQPLWHNEFSHSAQRPAIQGSEQDNWAIAYYDDDRLKMLLANSNGLGAPSVITKVSGFQPTPHLIAEGKPGSWLLAWRDFEAGHKEIFVARAQCFDRKGQ